MMAFEAGRRFGKTETSRKAMGHLTVEEMELEIAGMKVPICMNCHDAGENYGTKPRFPTLQRECPCCHDEPLMRDGPPRVRPDPDLIIGPCSECQGNGWVMVRDLETWLVAMPLCEWVIDRCLDGVWVQVKIKDGPTGTALAPTPYEAVVTAAYKALVIAK